MEKDNTNLAGVGLAYYKKKIGVGLLKLLMTEKVCMIPGRNGTKAT